MKTTCVIKHEILAKCDLFVYMDRNLAFSCDSQVYYKNKDLTERFFLFCFFDVQAPLCFFFSWFVRVCHPGRPEKVLLVTHTVKFS